MKEASIHGCWTVAIRQELGSSASISKHAIGLYMQEEKEPSPFQARPFKYAEFRIFAVRGFLGIMSVKAFLKKTN